MGSCPNCGKETNNKQFCNHCGSRITYMDNEEDLSNEKTIHKKIWSKILIYFFILFTLDIIGLSVMIIEFKNNNFALNPNQPTNMTFNVIAFVVVLIQTLTFYLVISPNINHFKKIDLFLYLILPMIHFLVLVSVIFSLSNYTIFSQLNVYIVTWGIIAGVISLYIRGPAIYDYFDLSSLTEKEISERNEFNRKKAEEKVKRKVELGEFNRIV